MSLEAKVGFFVILGATMLFLLTTQVSKFQHINSDGYRIKVFVDDSTGLEVNSKVKMNGINIGYLESLQMTDEFVILSLFVEEGYSIPTDSTVKIVQENLLGSKLIAIKKGQKKEYLSEGDFLRDYQDFATFEQTSSKIFDAAEEFRKFTEEVRGTLNQQKRDEIGEAISSLNTILTDIKLMLKENRSSVDNSLSSIEEATSKLPMVVDTLQQTLQKYRDVGVDLEKELPETLNGIQSLITELNNTVGENSEPLTNSLNSADSFFSQGSESINKLDSIIRSISDSEVRLGFRGEYNTAQGDSKIYVNIAYLPNPATYYIFDYISTPDYTLKDENGNFREPRLHDEGREHFSLQYGKRYLDLLIKIGLFESTGGVGVDYFFKNDQIKVSAEVFDFNAINDLRNNSPHLKTAVRYRLYDHLDFLVGVDNILNEHRGVFFGFGAFFLDNNLKIFAGSL
jgi:phospholipid/cholesterol/gamma-HCH transport system substrate-binding protein